jgi:outer membrane protein, heavy metal efflux system
MNRPLFVLFFVSSFYSIHLYSQTDTIHSLTDCERLFLTNNLALLAAKYDIDAAKASVIQARLWENPNFSIEVNAYNPERNAYFDVGVNGDKYFSIQQIIHIGGQKRFETEVAKSNADITQLQFFDLLRTLKKQLRQSYFSIYYDNLSYQAIIVQMESLNQLIDQYLKQVKEGNIALKDLVRLQSLYLDFRSKKSELYRNITENESILSLLVGKRIGGLIPTEAEINSYIKSTLPPIDSLYQLAIKNRPDYTMAVKQEESAMWNLKWQKSLAIPDLTFGTAFSQRGGAFNNQWTTSVSLPLELWNWNQGNIKSADAKVKSASSSKKYMINQVMQDLVLSTKSWKEASEEA